MSKDIFISYSRRDQEFVTRLAADLDRQVAGVWFDQSTIRAGQKWHDEIMEGIRECKAFVLVLSPDAMQSKYVREEVETALALGKPIFPVIYRPARWTDEFAQLVRDVQSINLQSGSYTDNFHKLVDGLVAAGAIQVPSAERPFFREPTEISLRVVFRKAVSWALAWSLGWLVFWILTFLFLFIFILIQNRAGWEDILNFLIFSFGGWIGGFGGGLIAGILSMMALRPYAPSIFWRHISPSIRIWTISGPLGMIVSGLLTATLMIVGVISLKNPTPSCQGMDVTTCLSRILRSIYSEDVQTILLAILVYFVLLISVWFLTGTFAGWLIVRHVRKLEPGITTRQAWNVSAGWGCGAIFAALFTLLTIRILATIFNL